MSESMSGTEAYYLPVGGGSYQATYATMSPWEPTAQHGGPPSALLAHEMTALVEPSMRLGRLAVDFLGPIPRAECLVEARITKPGRRVCRAEASLSVGGKVAVAASAWFLATGPRPPSEGVHDFDVPPLPDEQEQSYFPGLRDWGYGESIEWRFASGAYDAPGPAQVWCRPLVPLVAGREMTGLERAIVVADSANGLSNELPLGEWLFIPPAMTFTSFRAPSGPWVYMEAVTTLADDGLGLSNGLIGDADGMCGVVNQPLLIAPT
ncbi:thioesterase family protein [Blastococcus sp. Marseille-P5729]|uniref:thioesterase family protein n=1 Tax=Blastococcus sp. Marseille-P5729 TaxID=2086582 RepID=UPI0018FE6238|nr:thioesterase family protein [Blastococcus sp. Marseille-P5729]